MNKYYGPVGYADYRETAPGVWQEVITERYYTGDVLDNSRKLVGTEHLNDDIVVNGRISIIADPFAYQHYQSIRHVEWMGAKWKATHVKVAYPRLIIDLGGVYNEQT